MEKALHEKWFSFSLIFFFLINWWPNTKLHVYSTLFLQIVQKNVFQRLKMHITKQLQKRRRHV